MNTEIQRIGHLLKVSYAGETWHGPSLKAQLKDVNADLAARKMSTNIHSIWELVLHIIAWRRFCIEKLRGNDSYELPIGGKIDWPEVTEVSKEAWETALENLENNQQELLSLLKAKTDDILEKEVAGKSYTFYYLIHGIIQHDIYHGGQIALLKK